ncbi:MAG TPA: agmatinase family protein [Acidimicrobiia bacterium]|nr:agmatinase family protein [Acidimicrobiia bacterium]HZQ77538.1 agmatinase family protein [Acidimicrobiia bacterium]
MRARDPQWPTAADWLRRGRDDPPAETELAVLGVPLSVTSITQPAGAHETPAAIRRRLAVLSTYHSERDVDVGELAAVDFGDLDLQPSNKEIASATSEVVREAPMAVLLGGDNAVTYPALLGMAGEGLEGWGLVTLDAHHDVRTYEGRPGNGSPVRALIDAGLPGNQVVQVGIAGFANSVAYRRWCDEVGIDVVTAAEVRFGTIEDVLVEAFERLAMSVDHVYVDLDVDVLDSAFAPACPGARPGGLFPGELLAAAFLAGRNPRVRAIDIVEVDASRDIAERTVDVAALCLLNAAAGLHERLR